MSALLEKNRVAVKAAELRNARQEFETLRRELDVCRFYDGARIFEKLEPAIADALIYAEDRQWKYTHTSTSYAWPHGQTPQVGVEVTIHMNEMPEGFPGIEEFLSRIAPIEGWSLLDEEDELGKGTMRIYTVQLFTEERTLCHMGEGRTYVRSAGIVVHLFAPSREGK